MIRDVSGLAGKTYDVIVVGGGIFGTCAAWEAASRGLKVALLEKNDFAHATSNNHLRMIHGGIRYLQHGDIVRVRESSKERSAMLRVAPHLVQSLPIVMPTYGHGMQGKEILRMGTLLYDLLTVDRNRAIPDPTRRIPPGKSISRQKVLEMYPDLIQDGLTGAVIFRDGQVYHPARLALAFLKSAMQAGAEAANYVEVRDFLREDGRVVGVHIWDTLSGQEYQVRGQVVLNAAGPWADRILGKYNDLRVEPAPVFSRDTCFIVNRPIFKATPDHAVTVLGQTKDPDAIISRGRRSLFAAPWQGATLIGVWHGVYKGDPEKFNVTAQELESYIEEFNGAYPALNLKLEDVSRWMAGLVLFGHNEPEQKNLSYGKRSQVVDHSKNDQVDGLVTMIGVRYTTARGVSEKAVDLVFKKLGRPVTPSKTTETRIHGGDFDLFERLVQEAERQAPVGLAKETIEALVHNHGTAYPEVFQYIEEDSSLAAPLGETEVIGAEVVHAIRDEMSFRLADVVFRRTNLGSKGHPGHAALQACAERMARELGWDSIRMMAEIEEVNRVYPVFSTAEPELA